ncbi:hypothetical protein [Streptomyces sp. AS02]|uniref:hypothetical protein n=1 Tax=Streptomyces sp. AS02 TaxID=2938946 RepID=UPI0020206FE6|nr:hypothetical protein [Streptomyces sp. AS02]MCL8014422.1 hypothetical protein [Streptomyces sp. AS02]
MLPMIPCPARLTRFHGLSWSPRALTIRSPAAPVPRRGSLLLDGETLYPVGANVTDAVFRVLVFVPAWGLLPFGVMGAAAGSGLPRLLRLAR